ncbi:hypothetical protein [Clostridium rectalis]|uniref:hypothetical protein n=1 Tax=Clostridium rectalis TaxID=2040295 RepID=UPI000F643070|nr:hypothetical protein [Clostridium rectalis]
MHDSFLMQNISSEIKRICKENGLKRVTFLEITVAHSSHITEDNLLEHLKDLNGDLINKFTKVKVNYEDIEELIAIIKEVQGEKN